MKKIIVLILIVCFVGLCAGCDLSFLADYINEMTGNTLDPILPSTPPTPGTEQKVVIEQSDLFRPSERTGEASLDRYLESDKASSLSTSLCETAEDLYATLLRNRRPQLLAGSEAEELYLLILNVLDKISFDDMTDTERVIAYYQWLIFNVQYDIVLYQDFLSGKSVTSDDPAFDLRGVFFNRRAVCDGFSKAFLVMCKIDGITDVYRVIGRQNSDLLQATDVLHAWNKVAVDANEDGEVEFYNVDCTSGNVILQRKDEDTVTYVEYLSNNFVLRSDEVFRSLGIVEDVSLDTFAVDYPAAVTDYDFFSKQRVSNESGSFDFCIRSHNSSLGFTELQQFLAWYVFPSKICGVEISLQYPPLDPPAVEAENRFANDLSSIFLLHGKNFGVSNIWFIPVSDTTLLLTISYE